MSLVEVGGVATLFCSLLGGEGCSSDEEHSLSVLTDNFLLFLPPDGLRLGGEASRLRDVTVPSESVSVLKASSSCSSGPEEDREDSPLVRG